ncbi:MAG: hypothetical protein ACR2PZ_06835 [Pseudomonadales bacterium]
MTTSIILLAIAYAAVAALLLSLNLATRYARSVKAAAIAVVTGLYGFSWIGLNGVMGWATPAAMPADFRVLWIAMDEPDKTTQEPGFIYFWVRSLDEAGLPVGAPRAHRVQWNEASAEAAQAALAQIEEGELLNGSLGRSLVGKQSETATGTQDAGTQAVTGNGGERPNFEFVRVPPPALPPKSLSN